MNTKLYVDNLDATTTYNDLMELFSAHGNVSEVNLPVDRANGRPRGFGFVTMATPEGARAAVQALHGKKIGTHTLTVSETLPREEPAGLPGAGRSARRRASYLF
jgi:cold-inducible RNA-binding protein